MGAVLRTSGLNFCERGKLRKQCMQFWMDLFSSLSDNGDFCGDALDKAFIQFCFMDIIQVIFT